MRTGKGHVRKLSLPLNFAVNLKQLLKMSLKLKKNVLRTCKASTSPGFCPRVHHPQLPPRTSPREMACLQPSQHRTPPSASCGCPASTPSWPPHPCLPCGDQCLPQAPRHLLCHVFTLLFSVIYKTHTAHEFVFLIPVRSLGSNLCESQTAT